MENMKERYCSPKAFTLIEVLVVFSIISIVTAVMLVSISDQRNVRYVDRASREVAAVLREAQGYALAGWKGSTSQSVCGYHVVMPAGSAYSVVNTYPSGGCGSTATIAAYSLKAGVTFPGYTNIAFSLPRAETSYWNGATMVPIASPQLITVSRSGLSYYICVYSTGRIVENGTNSTCP